MPTTMETKVCTIRPAVASDLPVIVRIKLRMFEESGRSQVLAPDAYACILEVYRSLYRQMSARHFVMEHEGRIVACAGAFLKRDLPFCFYRVPFYGFIGDVYTHPDCRRRGYARRLTEEAIRWLKDQGVETIRLLATPQGRPLYREMGFEPTDEMVLRLE